MISLFLASEARGLHASTLSTASILPTCIKAVAFQRDTIWRDCQLTVILTIAKFCKNALLLFMILLLCKSELCSGRVHCKFRHDKSNNFQGNY